MIKKIHVIDNSLPEKIDVVIMNKEQENDRN